MSRDGSGVYTLPAIYEAVDGNTATAAQHNTPLEDLEADANTARPVVAGGTGATTAGAARTNLGVDPSRAYSAKSGNYTAVAGDKAVAFRFTAAATLSLTAAATLGNGWWCSVRADGGNVTIDPNSTEQIDGATTITVFNGMTLDIVCNGTAFFSFYRVSTLTLESIDAGATAGPTVNLYRNSASPAQNDLLASINFQGKDSAGNIETYAGIGAQIIDPFSGTETGELILRAMINGTLTNIAKVEASNSSISPITNTLQHLGSTGLRWGYLYSENVNASAAVTGGNSVNAATFSATGASGGSSWTGAGGSTSRNTTASAYHLAVYNPNGLVGGVRSSASATAFDTSSDETLKDFHGVYDPEEAMEIIRATPTMKFSWKIDGTMAIGWGAQTSYAVSPDLASPGGWFNRETGEPCLETDEGAMYFPWAVDFSKRAPYMWAVIPWIDGRVAALEATVAALEARLAALEA